MGFKYLLFAMGVICLFNSGHGNGGNNTDHHEDHDHGDDEHDHGDDEHDHDDDHGHGEEHGHDDDHGHDDGPDHGDDHDHHEHHSHHDLDDNICPGDDDDTDNGHPDHGKNHTDNDENHKGNEHGNGHNHGGNHGHDNGPNHGDGHDNDDDHGHGGNHEDHDHGPDHGDGHDNDDDHGHDNDHDHDHGEECPTSSYMLDGDWYYETMRRAPKLKDITISTHVTTNKGGAIRGVIASIHNTEKKKKILVLGKKENDETLLRVIVDSQQRNIPLKLKPRTEYHLIIIIIIKTKKVIIYLDGKKVEERTYRTELRMTGIPKGGRVMIGKAFGSRYPMYQGKLNNFMVWDRVLSEHDIEELQHDHCTHDPVIVLNDGNIVPQKARVNSKECPGVEYTFNNTGDNVEYLELETLPESEFITVCAKITTNDRGVIPGAIASYATADEADMMSITGAFNATNDPINLFMVGGQRFERPGQFVPNTKYSMCIWYHFKHNHLITYINNHIATMISFHDVDKLTANGIAIMAQRQRRRGGCFDRHHAYTGKIEDFMIWRRALSIEEIMGYTAGKCPTDPVITADKTKVVPHGKLFSYKTCLETMYTLNNTGNMVEYVTANQTIRKSDYLTVCSKVVTDAKGMIPGAIASYSTKKIPKSLIVGGEMGAEGPMVHITLNGQTKKFPGVVKPNTEYSFCISIHTSHGHALTYINGRLSREMVFRNPGAFPRGGTTIVGQAQGCPGGCFDRKLAFNGQIKNFMVWDRALSTQEITSIAMNEDCPDDNVIDLRDGQAAKMSDTTP